MIFAFFADVSAQWMLAMLTAIVSVLGWIYNNSKNTQRDIDARLFSQKSELYKRVFGLFFDQIKRTRADEFNISKTHEANAGLSDGELLETMFAIKSDMLVWGSDETIAAWIKMENDVPSESGDSSSVLNNWGNLYACMRADLGHKDIKISEKDLIGFFLTVEDRNGLVGK